ncbi:MAG: hypothetical protein OXT09_09145 [Myxococcales bacterium]|nr:hypothetical protein [Myxococcales bacterium]
MSGSGASGPAARPARLPLLIFAVTAVVYVATLGGSAKGTSSDPHFLYLADSFLHGQLSLVSDKPPNRNDWALYEGRWYVSFPPFPAVVVAPLVAVWGVRAWDRLFWALLAGLGPALLFVLLRRLSVAGHSERSTRDNLLLTALFAFGSVYYYTSVQGTVWHAAHVVATILLALYLLFAVGARHPLLAGLALGCAFMTRPATAPLCLIFALEALRVSRRDGTPAPDGLGGVLRLSHVDTAALLRRCLVFAAPILAIGCLAMWLNAARFDDPFEFGHSHLQIRWRPRIEKWGLFNYHYLAKNLSVFLAGLPWLTAESPHVMISRHGLALWVTTPAFLLLLWPRRSTPTLTALTFAAACVALLDLCYQNSGWVQFGYRFSLDYAVVLIAMLAIGGRHFGRGFHTLLAIAFAVNLFGAITFDRHKQFYSRDASQKVIFQPD